MSMNRLGSQIKRLQRPEISDLDLLYRGEVYRWNSTKKDRDGNIIRECIIIIQTDLQNNLFETTIALLCTTNKDERAAIDFYFNFGYEVMPDYNVQRLKEYNNQTFYVSGLKEINRKEIGDYLGIFNNNFMDTLQSVVDSFLGLKRSRNISKFQIRILSRVDMDELLDIVDSCSRMEKKIVRCLEHFGFNMEANGMEYVKDAILIATGLPECKLDVLAQFVAEKDNVDASEVSRLIVARVKENFALKNAHTMEFIRIIVSLLKEN